MTTGDNDFYYSPKYEDDEFEYRHVHITKDCIPLVPRNHLMTETEWRSIGIQQSQGWVHYMIHAPERHVILFRRPKPKTAPDELANNKVEQNGHANHAKIRKQ